MTTQTKIEFVKPGYDPTLDEYIPEGPTLSGCLLKIGVVLGIVFGIGWFLTNNVSKAAPAPTAPATEAATDVPTAAPTQTPYIIYATAAATTDAVIPPPPTVAPTQTLPPTYTPTRTPTATGTPFPGELWVSVRPAWPTRDALTQSGVSWKAVIDTGAACPAAWPLGSGVQLESGERYLCVDRAKTAACKDTICTIIVFTQQKISPALRPAYLVRK